MRKVFVFFALILSLSACGQPGHIQISPEQAAVKKGFYYQIGGGPQAFRPIDIICFIDTEKFNPLNVLDYTLKDSGLNFFDYVILSGASIRRDEKGFYLHLTDSLERLLVHRRTYIEPLQNAGIKVLLGVESDKDASFGHLDHTNVYPFTAALNNFLRMHRFDGIEFFDNADDSVYPALEDFYPGKDGFHEADEWLVAQWKQAGDNFNNIFYIIRQNIFLSLPETLTEETRRRLRDDPVLIVREHRFGRLLPSGFSVPEGYGEFTSTSAELTYSFNPFFNRFPMHSSLITNKGVQTDRLFAVIHNEDALRGESWQNIEQYGPLAIDLAGSPQRNILFPLIENADEWVPESGGMDISLWDWFRAFRRGGGINANWRGIYFKNLQPIAEAERDPYFRWITFNENLPTTDWELEDGSGEEWNPEFVPMLTVFNDLSMELFNEGVVVSPGGGERVKDW